METSDSSRGSSWGLPLRVRPRLFDLFVGFIVSIATYTLLWLNVANLLVDSMIQVLSVGQIPVARVLSSDVPTLVVRLLDGSSLHLALTWQRLGLVSIAVFGLLIVFLVFPLEGSIWLKIAWLQLGFLIGLTWSFIRLTALILVAYHFGVGASKIVEFSTTPFLDFLWVIATWAVAVSTLTRHRSGDGKKWY